MEDKTQLKIAFLDIENSPNLGWVWGKWEQDVIDFEAEWHILSFSVKWVNSPDVQCLALPDFKRYRRCKDDDKELVKALWNVLDEADIIIAHNGDRFDLRKINARFLLHGLTPPSPYKTIDTLKIARKYFDFNSNKLGDLARLLGIGEKVKHPGFELWKGCMQGDMKSWELMKTYNAHDVELLEQVYEKLRPWHTTHPNIAVRLGEKHACPVCASTNTKPRGYRYAATRRARSYVCINCGKWSQGPYEKIQGELLR